MRAKPWLRLISVIIALAALAALLIWAFLEGRKEVAVEQERERPVKAPLRVAIEEGESVITLDQATQKKSGIVVAPLKAVSHQDDLRAYGMVMDLQDLVDLRNSIAMAKAQVEKARASLEASRKEYERTKALQENRNISAKVFQAAEATWRSDEASARAAGEALHVLEGTVRQRWGTLLASWLFDSSPAFERLIQRQDVLVQVTLPPAARLSSPPRYARIQSAEAKLTSATLVSPSPRTDPRIQGMSFFYLAPVQATDLLPGMNVIAYLPSGSQIGGVLVPASAVVLWQGKAWVYRQKESGRFVRREISTDTPVQEGWFVREGLSAGDQVVVRGAQLLLSEEFRAQIQISQ
jgi:hypothetical protein